MAKRKQADEKLRLSHSSANLLRGCEKRYHLYKVAHAKNDPDYEENDSLSIGKAFHHIQEKTKHQPAPLGKLLKECVESEDIGLKIIYFGLVAGMCQKYWTFHEDSGTEIIGIEYQILTDKVIGYVDIITKDRAGWYIEDLKCFKGFYPATAVKLPKDPQINLYAYHAPEIAERYGLKLEDFKGAGWRVITKSSARKRPSEKMSEYARRVAGLTKVHRIIVPADRLDPAEAMDLHTELFTTAELLHETDYRPDPNYNYCMNYFSPCQYWSKCYGKTYSESLEEAEGFLGK